MKEEESKKIWLIGTGNPVDKPESNERRLYYNYLSYTNPRTSIVPVRTINI
jgi:hypothetical protein